MVYMKNSMKYLANACEFGNIECIMRFLRYNNLFKVKNSITSSTIFLTAIRCGQVCPDWSSVSTGRDSAYHHQSDCDHCGVYRRHLVRTPHHDSSHDL